jgi:hypothetical protein
MPRKSSGQWAEIRADYERGASFLALGKRHGLSHTAIGNRAKTEGWRQNRGVPRAPAGAVSGANSPTDPDAIVSAGRSLIARMLSEVDALTTHQGELAEVIELETADDRDLRRRDAMLRAIGLASRVTMIKNLAAAAKTFTEMAGDGPAKDKVGKKDQAQAEAELAGEGTDWGDDLVPATRPWADA